MEQLSLFDNRELSNPLASRLRPQTLSDFVGQEHLLGPGMLLRQLIEQDKISSMIFWGPPGVGKTTLARIIAGHTHAGFVDFSAVTSGIKEIKTVMAQAEENRKLGQRTLLFVDEIHRLNRQVEEVLYPAMEDYAIDIMLGKDSAARSIRLDLPRFTLVGATTRAGLLTAPLRDRFGVVQKMEFYTPKELEIIVCHSAKVLEVEIEPEGAAEIAKRSRGTPRLANRLLKRVRDFAQVKYNGVITKEVADFALDNHNDREIFGRTGGA